MLWISSGVLLLLMLAGLWFWRSCNASGRRFESEIEELGLKDFNARLREEVLSRRRPMDHLALTRVMRDVLREINETVVPPGQAGLIEPPDEFTRLACEELVKLGRLSRAQDGRAFLIPGAPASDHSSR